MERYAHISKRLLLLDIAGESCFWQIYRRSRKFRVGQSGEKSPSGFNRYSLGVNAASGDPDTSASFQWKRGGNCLEIPISCLCWIGQVGVLRQGVETETRESVLGTTMTKGSTAEIAHAVGDQ
jgi:hypothetical protein